MIKQSKGITLIALVVTIVILLIIAGVTIQQLTGNTLFEKAKLAREKQDNVQKSEDNILKEYEKAIKSDIRGSSSYDENIYDIWTTWLNLAGIENPEKYNEQDICSNNDIMNKVMNNEKALEYMLKSENFIKVAVLNSNVAMEQIKSSETALNKIVNNDKWFNYMKNTAQNLLPTYDSTSNTKDGVTISASDSHPGTEEYRASDGNLSTNWSTYSGNYNPHWFQVEFDKTKIVTSYYLNGAYGTGTLYKFNLQASEDGNKWTSLEGNSIHDGVNSSTAGEWKFEINNKKAYKYYRIYFPQGGWTWGSSGGCAIMEVKLFGI